MVRYFIDGSNSYFSDDFSGDLDEYLKKIRGYSYEYYNPNGVIDIYSVRKQDTLLDIKAFEPEQTAGWAFKTIQRKPLAGGFGNEELQIIANEFAPYNITLGPDNRLYFNGELILHKEKQLMQRISSISITAVLSISALSTLPGKEKTEWYFLLESLTASNFLMHKI